MRLIDADKLRERYNVVDPAGTFTYCSSILQEIDNAPTVDAIPTDILHTRCHPSAEQEAKKLLDAIFRDDEDDGSGVGEAFNPD